MADAGMGYLYTIGGYATLIGIGYAIYHISTQKDKKRSGITITKNASVSQPESRKEDRKKKQRMESFVSEKSAKAESKTTKDAAAQDTQWLSNAADNDKQEEINNREFARQLAKAKEGTKFNTKNEGSKQREKSVKQSHANQKVEKQAAAVDAPPAFPSAASSNGADADDDESPITSPEVRPTDVSGVSDMLEPAPAGPSVLRLTDTEDKKQPKKAAKAPEPAETKKQRQNRKKAEAAKASREESEKERKILEEKQRRTARIAEGRPAKDGSQFMAANGAKSAWSEGAHNGTNGVTSNDVGVHAPLDTFEKPVAPAAVSAPLAAPEPASKNEATLKPEGSWMSSLPSEEEQMEMLKDESDEWNTVKTKTSKKSKKAPSVESGEEPSQARPAAQPKQPVPGANKSAKATPNQSFGSFSALTTKDEPAEEAEEEWEV